MLTDTSRVKLNEKNSYNGSRLSAACSTPAVGESRLAGLEHRAFGPQLSREHVGPTKSRKERETIVTKKRLFVDKGRPHGTVVLNWQGTPEREFSDFAQAFHLVAQEAVAALRQNPHFGLLGIPIEDFRAYPVVFLYRHTLELYMKAVILVGSPMLAVKGMPEVDRQALLKTHSLDSLRQDLERVFEAYEWEWDLGTPYFQSLEDFRKTIAELHEVDAGSYAFRYPLDTKGGASLASHFRFDLFEFCEVLDSLFSVFEGAAFGAYEELQATLEAMAEAHRLEMENAEYEPHDE